MVKLGQEQVLEGGRVERNRPPAALTFTITGSLMADGRQYRPRQDARVLQMGCEGIRWTREGQGPSSLCHVGSEDS